MEDFFEDINNKSSNNNDTIVKEIAEHINTVKIKCYKCGSKFEFLKKVIPDSCPKCNYTLWWYKPDLERELFILQKQFLDNNRDPKYLAHMYKPLLHYVKILLLKKIKNKKMMSKEDVSIKVQDTVTKLFIYMSDDKKYPNWKVDDSWAGVISNILLDTLYNHKNRFWEQHSSLNHIISNDKSNHKTELGDIVQGFGYRNVYHIESNIYKEVLCKNTEIIHIIVDLIKEIIEKIKFNKGERISLYVLVGLKYILENKKQDILDQYYSFVGSEIENLIKNFIEVIKDYIKLEDMSY